MGKAAKLKQTNKKAIISFGDLCIPFFEKHGEGIFINTQGRPFQYLQLKYIPFGDTPYWLAKTNNYYQDVLVAETLSDSLIQVASFPIKNCPCKINCTKEKISLLLSMSDQMLVDDQGILIY